MRTFVYIGTSLDGFIAREDGDIGWLTRFANDEAVDAYREFTKRIDAIVIGRGTFEKVLTFASWPYDKKAFVLSSSLRELPPEVQDKATLLSMPPKEVMNYLAEQGHEAIYVDGGKVIQAFLKEDLIDELIVARAPVLIGSGIPLFGYLPSDLAFTHIRTTVASNGLVRTYYKRARD